MCVYTEGINKVLESYKQNELKSPKGREIFTSMTFGCKMDYIQNH